MALRVTVAGDIRIDAAAIPPSDLGWIVDRLTFSNPAYSGALAAARARGSKRKPKISPRIQFFQRDGDMLMFPRGAGKMIMGRLRASNLDIELVDRRVVVAAEYPRTPSLRSYQGAAVDAMRRLVQSVGCMPCGAGKTWVGAGLGARCAQRMAVLVNSHDLADQWRETIREALGIEPGKLGDSQPAAVATIQSTMSKNFDPARAAGYGLLVLDEAHHVPAETFFHALPMFPARYRFGLTATPRRGDGLTRVIELGLGPIAHTSTFNELETGGWLMGPTIRPWRSGLDLGGLRDYGKALLRIGASTSRNKLIAKIARNDVAAGRTVMIIAARTGHLESLAGILAAAGTPAVLILGTMSKGQRRAALGMLRSGRARLALATNKLADEGLDIPRLDRMISASFNRSRSLSIQRAGRLTRTFEGKTRPVLHEIVDSGSLPDEHWRARRGAYTDEFGPCIEGFVE